ncbi:hypothetical protein [Aquimarina mytili]|uniref:YD repeat-containing protein n=1 Tax=Aquimarina mytili TaxID=874423 RepID=A0A937A1G0_9FLAO|nr:hypothetical protein [Aquimarina mytili]MBL0685725.1 hypothetical protein [Aquimarina mytili]
MPNLTMYKTKKRHLVLSLITMLLSGFSIYVKAQDNQHDFHPNKLAESIASSPEVSSLGNYGNINGNKYNGTINLSIPIYNLNFDGITLPIQISYDSKGVRTNQDASWVGLNWNLMAYSAITRTINGSDDLRGETTSRGFLYNNYNVQEPQGADPYIPYNQVRDLHTGFASMHIPIDMEPDLFELNLLGKAYKFRFKKKQANSDIVETVVFNDNTVRIVFNFRNKSFTIRDDKGFKFIFATKEINTSFSTVPHINTGLTRASDDFQALMGIFADPNRKEESIITSWLLSSIESPYGRKIVFTYKEGLHFSFPRYSEYTEVSDQNLIQSDGSGITSGGMYVQATTTVIENQYLESIYGDFGEIEFIHAPRLDLVTPLVFSKMTNNSNIFLVTAKGEIRSHPATPSSKAPLLLNNIKVKNSDNEVVRDIVFNHSYFNQHKSNDVHKEKYLRLKLDELVIDDKRYNFEYISPNSLPTKDTKDVDFWGFYNGANNSERIPSIGRFVTSAYAGTNLEVGQAYVDNTMANRSAAFAHSKIGALNKVTYPTGGYSEFEYEGHEALIKVTQPYTITERLSNGRYRWTNLIDEEKYNFTYQYLKKAKDPSYRLIDHVDQGANEAFDEVNVSTNSEFTITEPTSFKASGSRKCHHNCDNVGFYSGYPMRSILNVATGQEQVLFNYGTSNFNVQKTLSPGTYKVITKSLPYSSNNPGWPGIEVVNESNIYKIYLPKNVDNPTAPRLYEAFEIGGLRVKSITNYLEDNSFSNKKIYEYDVVNAYNEKETTGILMDDLLYFSKAYGSISYTPRLWGQSTLKLDSESTLRTLPSAQGSHIGYSVVYEKDVDASGNTNGTIETKYVNNPNEYHKISFRRPYYDWGGISGHNPPDVSIKNAFVLGIAPKNSFGYINGNVTEEILYNQQGDRVRSTKNRYKTLYGIASDRSFARVMAFYYNGGPPMDWGNDHMSYFTYRFPHHYAQKSVLEESTTEEYLNAVINTTQSNVFNETTHHLRISKSKDSDNHEIETRYYYPYDSDVYDLPYMDELREANRISTPVKSEAYRDNTLLNSQITNYGYNIFITQNRVLQKSVEAGKGVITTANPLQKTIEFERYDDRGNILQYKKADGPTISYIWGHNKMYPLAKIENATFTEAAAALGISQGELMNFDLSYSLDTLRDNLPQAMVTTYTYEPLIGMTSMTNPKGYTTYYEYDNFNRLMHQKDAEENITNKFYYGYAGVTDSSSEYDPLAIRFKNFPEFAATHKQTGFQVTINGGSGQYDYKWEFEAPDGKVTTIENKPSHYFHFKMDQAGYNTIRVKLTDKVTGEKKTITQGLTVYGININTPREVKVATNASFSVAITGGSGNYSYKWLIYGRNFNHTPTTRTFTMNMSHNFYGIDKFLICEVTDNTKGHTIKVYRDISVYGAEVGQSWNTIVDEYYNSYMRKDYKAIPSKGSGDYTITWTSSADPNRPYLGDTYGISLYNCGESGYLECTVTDNMSGLKHTKKMNFYFNPDYCNNNGGGSGGGSGGGPDLIDDSDNHKQ